MSKAVLMSLSPYWYYLIGEGIKTEEVRKTIPKALDWNGQIECYMTKDEKSFKRIPKEFQEKYRVHIGKVGMRFMCDDIDDICCMNGNSIAGSGESWYREKRGTCLTPIELMRYGKGKFLYSLHISDLVIYDKPRELGEFARPCDGCDKIGTSRCTEEISPCRATILKRPPQSWQFVQEV